MKYSEYLQTKHWKHVRESALKRQPYCALCGSKDRLQVHHNNYDRLWKEDHEDVVVLCWKCHKHHHIPEEPTHVQPRHNFWPVVHMDDGTIAHGTAATIIGVHTYGPTHKNWT